MQPSLPKYRWPFPQPIFTIATGFNVAPVKRALDENPELWNQHSERTAPESSPHREAEDIWLRFNHADEIKNNRHDPLISHESVWYPCLQKLAAAKPLIFDAMRLCWGTRLGGVLLTRLPPGKRIHPHTDEGWHAKYYNIKIGIQIAGHPDQIFKYDDCEYRANTGDVFIFDNSVRHEVINDSNEDRLTLIAVTRTA